MKATLQPGTAALTLDLESLAEASELIESAARQKGFVAALGHELRLFDGVRCVVTVAEREETSFTAQVVQVSPSSSGGLRDTAFQIDEPESLPVAQLARRAAEEQRLAKSTEPSPSRSSHSAEISPTFRVRGMKNPNERFRLATKASRTERKILLRDSQPQVLLGLLSNPHIEDPEILEIVKSNFASGGVMQRIAENRKWMKNPELQLAIVRSPKTPAGLAQKLLPNLRTQDLRVLAKMGNAREVLRKAALRIYLERTSKRSYG